MLPIFNEYSSMLQDFGIELPYSTNKLWVDRLIIRGFDKEGNQHKICRLNITEDLRYECKMYTKLPKDEDLETWEETYNRLEPIITERERESLSVLNSMYEKYNNYDIILPTSMGKDSKLTEHLVNKAGLPYHAIFNNTTCDSADVYKEVKQRKDIEIITPKDKDGNNLSLYKMMENGTGIASRHSRWCCSIFKEGGTKQYCKDKHNIMFIYGMRNEESTTRSNYKDEWKNILWEDDTWVGCLPIRKWTELELWLYTIHNNIPINSKYKKGYSRVGCHICCPFYTKSTWILDKYWYKNQYDRFHRIIDKDFVEGEKWTRMNCTKEEYHMNWNGGLVREEPTEEVIKEFQEYKGFESYDLAKQYFEKKCCNCGKKVSKKNEVAMNLKLFGRNINKFYCKKCLMKEMKWNKEQWDKEVDKFKQQGCSLF